MPIPKPAGLTSAFYTSQRLQLHYVDWGNCGAPPLILLHGGRDHSRSWDWVAERLRHDYRIIAPDLRGHGDSQWSPDGDYSMASLVFDLAELIHQLDLAPIAIVGHSLGGNIATRYTGLYPEKVVRLVTIEGLGPSPTLIAERDAQPFEQRMRKWVEAQRALSRRQPRRYGTFEEALTRMALQNAHLTPDQARHLTEHGVKRDTEGNFSWKFDTYARSISPVDITSDQLHALWSRIDCPTLLVYGANSWASNPAVDGRLAYFKTARVALIERAGHWVHHDQLDAFLGAVGEFLAS